MDTTKTEQKTEHPSAAATGSASMTTKTKIEAHLRQLAPHHRERASAILLIEAKEEIDRLRKVIGDLMPFVLEDYYPTCATIPFKEAVEAAIAETPNSELRGGNNE